MAQRAKIFQLDDEGRWDDKGIGHITFQCLEHSETLGFMVVDETDNSTLLVHGISADSIYRRQEDQIISWTDAEMATDMALSFLEAEECSCIWDQICNVQRSLHVQEDAFQDSGSGEVSDLPPMELGALPQIVKKDYIHKLVELFKVCEDTKNLGGLHMIFKIVKGIISLNDGRILDIMFDEDHIMDIVGSLEYNPEFPTQQDHRGFLRKEVVFKEAVQISDPAILSKIHQTYRIEYIKDVILPSTLDDRTFSTIRSIIMFNNTGVLSSLYNDNNFTSALFTKLQSSRSPEKIEKELVLFVQQLCNVIGNSQPSFRNELFSSLVEKGLFEVITSTLQSVDENLHLAGSEILIVILSHAPVLLRNFLVEKQGHTLFSLLVTGLLSPNGGLQTHLVEILRMLLDLETMDQMDKGTFLDIFYGNCMDQLVEILTIACPAKETVDPKQTLALLRPSKKSSLVSPEILVNVCDLLGFCLKHHGSWIKSYAMRNDLVKKVLHLTSRKEKYLVLAAVRFLRACVGLKIQDEFYNWYLLENDLFEPVIQAFLAVGDHNNLLNSAVCELVEFICKMNIKSLIIHLVESYSEIFGKFNHVNTFQELRFLYKQLIEEPSAKPCKAGGPLNEKEEPSLRHLRHLAPASSFPLLHAQNGGQTLEKHEYFRRDSDHEGMAFEGKAPSPSHSSTSMISNDPALKDVTLHPIGLHLCEDEGKDEGTSNLCRLEKHTVGGSAAVTSEDSSHSKRLKQDHS